MKKILIICVLIVSIIFISGCTSDEQASSEISTSSQTNDQSDLILKSSDVPGFVLQEYSLFAYPKDITYNLNDKKFLTKYTDLLPEGNRNVGQSMIWEDKTVGRITVAIVKYDSNSGIEDDLKSKENEMQDALNLQTADEREQYLTIFEYEEGNLKIGDYSFYKLMKMPWGDKGIYYTTISFYKKNGVCHIEYILEDKDESKKEAIRIAKIIESRLY